MKFGDRTGPLCLTNAALATWLYGEVDDGDLPVGPRRCHVEQPARAFRLGLVHEPNAASQGVACVIPLDCMYKFGRWIPQLNVWLYYCRIKEPKQCSNYKSHSVGRNVAPKKSVVTCIKAANFHAFQSIHISFFFFFFISTLNLSTNQTTQHIKSFIIRKITQWSLLQLLEEREMWARRLLTRSKKTRSTR